MGLYKTLTADAVAIALTPLRYYQEDLVTGADDAWAHRQRVNYG